MIPTNTTNPKGASAFIERTTPITKEEAIQAATEDAAWVKKYFSGKTDSSEAIEPQGT